MKFTCENGILTVFLTGRIDTSNADATEKAVNDILAANPHTDLVLDADELKYISSAGLRFILRLRKAYAGLRVVNASSDVYEIFDMTGFTEMIDIQKAFRRLSVDGCTVIGKGAKGTVYRVDDEIIIKVYHDPDSLPGIKRERELARKAFVLGIPTAISFDIVRVGDSYGSVFELLDAYTVSQMIKKEPENLEKYAGILADLMKKIHTTQVKPDDMPDIKDSLVRKWVGTCEKVLPADMYAKLCRLVEETPDTMNMLHCDYHSNNVMMQNGESILIDMDTLAHGHPVFELANVYITYVGFEEGDPGHVETFVGIPGDLCHKLWDRFLALYLGTDDPARLKEVEDKVRVMNYARRIRHILRRGEEKTEKGKAILDMCVNNLCELLNTVDTLDF